MLTSQFKNPHCCWICGNEVDLRTCNIDEYGMVVHGDCYFLKIALATESKRLIAKTRNSDPPDCGIGSCTRKRPITYTLMANPAEPTIRCPYCRVGNESRPMALRIEGWLQCENWFHNAMPFDPEFKCACPNCEASQSEVFPEGF